MKDTVVTGFKSPFNNKPFLVKLSRFIKDIKDGTYKDQIEVIRNTPDKRDRTALKEELPMYRLAGKFMGWNDSDLYEHSGLISLDFDDIETYDEMMEMKDSIMKTGFIVACFQSPSSNRLKAIARIPPEIKLHRGHFRGLMEAFDGACDSTSVNEARGTFVSYDPDIRVNYDAQVFDTYIEDVQKNKHGLIVSSPEVKRNLTIEQRIINMIDSAVEGSRHDTVLKACRLAGGYIATGVLDENTITDRIINSVERLFSGEKVSVELKAVRDGIKHGKESPVYLESYSTTSSVVEKTITDNGIIFLNEMWNKMKDQFLRGKIKGETTFIPELDNHYTFKEGEVSLFSGVGNSGKSTFLYYLLVLQAKYGGHKSAVFTPENEPADEFYDTLIEMYIGKSTDRRAGRNQMTEEEYSKGAAFIKEHFFFIYPDTAHTIAEIESNFMYAITNLGVKFCVVDPYNQLAHRRPAHQREDEYLSEFLTERKRFATAFRINYIMVAHPNTTIRPKEGGEYPVMNFFNLAGGAMWSAKIDNYIVVHRPYQEQDPSNTEVDIYVKKIKKQKLVGIPGMVSFIFNRRLSQFFIKGSSQKENSEPTLINEEEDL